MLAGNSVFFIFKRIWLGDAGLNALLYVADKLVGIDTLLGEIEISALDNEDLVDCVVLHEDLLTSLELKLFGVSGQDLGFLVGKVLEAW